jgi:hypothetical protein
VIYFLLLIKIIAQEVILEIIRREKKATYYYISPLSSLPTPVFSQVLIRPVLRHSHL